MIALAPTALFLLLAQPPAAPVPIEVTGARFFAIDARTDPPGIVESTTIPHRAQTSCFGWGLDVAPHKGEVTIREELRLPGPAGSWGTAPGTTVHPDRSGASRQLTDDISDGILTNGWCISPGDPAGAHHISIYQGDRLLHRFDFVVVEPPRAI
ncbi:MAG TPA: hypothetical protein VF702_09420 [Allosphingosinicella sp.]|jgi:hypothetical protein